VYAALLAAAIGMRARGPRVSLAARGVGLALAFALVGVHFGPPPRGPGAGPEVTVIDVGQGQAVLLQGPSGGCVLVDAGGTSLGRFDAGERVVAPVLSRSRCRRIDTLVVSHDHDDHAGGASAILREFEVGELWIAAGTPRDALGRRLAAEAVERGVAVVLAARGLRAVRAGLPIEVLHPPRESPSRAPNERCLVLRVGPPAARVLIPADLESPEEEALLASGADPSAEALVVGHHGGSHGTRPAFVAAVRPRVAVVSVGLGNRFGHPDPGIVARLRKGGIPLYRTDLDGQVRLRRSAAGFDVEVTRRAGAE
jgi:competence protein ComEC